MSYYRVVPTSEDSGRKSDLSSSSNQSSRLELVLRKRDESEVKLNPISYSQTHMLITDHNPHIWDQIFAILDVINVNCKRNLHIRADKALGSGYSFF
jgi:hypothetical protein